MNFLLRNQLSSKKAIQLLFDGHICQSKATIKNIEKQDQRRITKKEEKKETKKKKNQGGLHRAASVQISRARVQRDHQRPHWWHLKKQGNHAEDVHILVRRSIPFNQTNQISSLVNIVDVVPISPPSWHSIPTNSRLQSKVNFIHQ